MFTQPGLRQQTVASVAELDHLFAGPNRLQEFRQGDSLVAELDATFEVEPVEAGGQAERSPARGPEGPALGLDLPALREELTHDPGHRRRTELQPLFAGGAIVRNRPRAEGEESGRGGGLGARTPARAAPLRQVEDPGTAIPEVEPLVAVDKRELEQDGLALAPGLQALGHRDRQPGAHRVLCFDERQSWRQLELRHLRQSVQGLEPSVDLLRRHRDAATRSGEREPLWCPAVVERRRPLGGDERTAWNEPQQAIGRFDAMLPLPELGSEQVTGRRVHRGFGGGRRREPQPQSPRLGPPGDHGPELLSSVASDDFGPQTPRGAQGRKQRCNLERLELEGVGQYLPTPGVEAATVGVGGLNSGQNSENLAVRGRRQRRNGMAFDA